MSTPASYLFKILYSGLNVKPGWVFSLSPVKTSVTFASGTYRDLSGQTDSGKATGLVAIGDLLVAIDTSTPSAPVERKVTLTTAAASGADDFLHIPPRAFSEPYDCWVFTNANGDVVASPKCKDVLDFNPYLPPPGQFRAPNALTPADGVPVPVPFSYLFVGGAGDVIVQLPQTNADGTVNAEATQKLSSVAAGSTIQISGIGVNATNTTATSLFYW